MNCESVQDLLHPFADGELDLVRHVEIERHLNTCDDCEAAERQIRNLKTAISSKDLYYRAPSTLRLQLDQIGRPVERSRWPIARLTAIAASALFLTTALFIGNEFFSPSRSSFDSRIVDTIIANHVRSLQVDHATDVASSDRHTVKPWFRDKLDYSPQIPNLTEQGYELSGGRLDYVTDRAIAALVYFRRLHPINVFVSPAANDHRSDIKRYTRHGFHLRHWQQFGMTYWTISDLNDEELDEFVHLFQRELVAPVQ